MEYIIGVDAGGTKTEAAAFDREGGILASAISGFGNLLIDPQLAIQHILEAICECRQRATGNCTYLVLGVAGMGSGLYRGELEAAISNLGIPYHITNDAHLAHAALLQGRDGCLAIAGTGSVCYGVRAGKHEMTGGWGHLLGDEGSGYWIVMEAFKAMTRQWDRSRSLSPLSQALLEKLGLLDPPAIKSFIYAKTKGEVAALVPVIVHQARLGDMDAGRILEEAGCFLGEMVLANLKRLGFEGETPIAMKGSILVHIPEVQDAFKARIRSRQPKALILDKDLSAAAGGYYLSPRATKEERI